MSPPPRTLHLQGMGRLDFSLWYADIQRAAGGKGNTLREQQLSRNDIPIIVDSCIAFITQYGKGGVWIGYSIPLHSIVRG